jgi:hypothetical protein
MTHFLNRMDTMSEIDGHAISAWLRQHQDLDVTPERAQEIATIAFRLNRVTLDTAMAQDSLDDPARYFRTLVELADFKRDA